MNNKALTLFLLVFSCYLSADDFRFYDSRYLILADLGRVEIGFTRDQARTIMNKYMLGTGWHPSSGGSINIGDTERKKFEIDTSIKEEMTLKNCDVYRHSTEAKYNADWAIICYENGLVEYTDFAYD